MGLKRFNKEVAAKLPGPVYYLWASDDFLLWEAYVRVKSSIKAEDQEMGLDVFDAGDDDFTVQALLESLSSGGLFGTKRIAVVKRFEELKTKRDISLLVEYLKDPSQNTLVILSKKSPLKDIPKELQDALKEHVIIDLNLNEQEAIKFIKEMGRIKGLSLEGSAVKLLLEITDNNFGQIYWELESLSLAGYKHVDESVIEEAITGSQGFPAFKVARSIIGGRKDEAFKAVARASDIDKYSFIGALNWYIRNEEKKGKIDHLRARQLYEYLLKAEIASKASSIDYPLEVDIFRLLSC